MENIEDMKFLTRELAIMMLRTWAKEHGKKPTQEELEDCIEVRWEEDGRWMASNMDGFIDNLPAGAYYGIINYLEDIDE
ncbi:MAG: Dyp-type peroxidase [Treponema sp.]|jgi:hypothetical protein|nr:Dyp-type peroxidase [Treponema sp.]